MRTRPRAGSAEPHGAGLRCPGEPAVRGAAPRTQRGFTLLEAVMTIVLTGIVASMVAVFMRRPVEAYLDVGRRAALTDAADLALRRITRELQQALPNSVRVDATGSYLEFLPVSAGGRYRAAPQSDASGDFLDFTSATDNSFEVLGPAVPVSAGDQLVIYNLGTPGADAYAGNTRRALTSTGSGVSTLAYTVGSAGQFPYPSPGRRFQIVGAPVTYWCFGVPNGSGSLRRYTGYAIQAAQPTNAAAAPLAALAAGPKNAPLVSRMVSSCSFNYSPGPTARTGVVTLRLTLLNGGESLMLLRQVQVDNTP